MNKRLFKFSSLFFAVAMLLGLMVTACSDKDRDKVTPEGEDGAVLLTTVGFEGETNGLDCPLTTKYIRVIAADKNGDRIVSGVFGATAGKDVTAWSENTDGTVTMALHLTKEQLAESPTTVFAGCVDENFNILGGYFASNVNFDEPIVEVDFSDGEYQFHDIKNIKGELEIEGYSDEEHLTVAEGEEQPVKVLLVLEQDDVIIKVNVSNSVELISATDNVQASVGETGATIKGVNASINNVVTAKLKPAVEGVPGKDFYVDVTGEDTYLYTTVGFSASSNGTDCPKDTKYIRVTVSNKAGDTVASGIFGPDDEQYVTGWTKNADGTVTMPLQLTEEQLAKTPTTVFAGCVDDGKDILGGYFASNVNFDDPIVKVDFSSAQYEFKKIADCKGQLEVDGYSAEEHLKVAVGEEQTVKVLLVLKNEEAIVKVDVSYSVDLTSDDDSKVEVVSTAALPTIKGVAQSTGTKVTAALKTAITGVPDTDFLVDVVTK